MKKLLARFFTANGTRDALLAEGDAALEQGDPAKALSLYDRLLAAAPRNGLVLARKSAALLGLDRVDDALHCVETATAAAPDLIVAWIERARPVRAGQPGRRLPSLRKGPGADAGRWEREFSDGYYSARPG